MSNLVSSEEVVFMDRGNYTTCTVHLHGGTISSYRVNNKEILYFKKKTAFNHFSPIRGGIKYTFPYYGRRVNGPKHGFARYVPWKLEEGPTTNADRNIEAVFSLTDTEYTKAVWNFNFKITFKLILCMYELQIELKVENTSKYFPFIFRILRHSIFRLEDLNKCEIYGLKNCKYLRLSKKCARGVDQIRQEEKLVINEPTTDLLFVDVPSSVEIRNIDDTGLKLRITACSNTAKDVLVFNPWTGPVEEDYPDEYLYFVGVGSGHLSSDIRLEPKQVWESRHVIEVVNEQNEKKVNELAELLDNPWQLFHKSC